MLLACVGAVLAVLLALAGNAATSDERWPGLVDSLRTHPWPWVAGLGAVSIAAAALAAWLQEGQPGTGEDPPPPPPPEVPEWFVDRAQTRTAVAAVLRGGRAVAVTTSFWGAGGFGKTTLATAVCAERRVQRRFRGRIYFVTIGRDVRGRAAVATKVGEVTRFVTGDTTQFDDPGLAGAHLGRLLEQRPPTLLVLDDVWDMEQLRPFLRGGRRCVRLVTTRNPDLLPPQARRIRVDEMSSAQARIVLTWGLPPLPGPLVENLLRATGRWALLLRLTNRLIGEQVAAGVGPSDAAEQLLGRLRTYGPAAVDAPSAAWSLDDPHLRNQAVDASVRAATELLPPGGEDHFAELGVFAEDESIPVSMVVKLWQATGGLNENQSRALCRGLERLSVLSLTPQDGGRISLHDVVRDYLRARLGEAGLARVNALLVDAIAVGLPPAEPLSPTASAPGRAWWHLQDGYLTDHLIEHLLAAGHRASAEAVATDIRWVEARLAKRGPSAPWNDLVRVGSPRTRLLAHSLARAAHLLTPTDPPQALTNVLHCRLDTDPHWHSQITARRNDPALRPCLASRWPRPDAAHPAQHRILTGHTRSVRSVAISPDGTWLATTSDDVTVRIWDRATGACTATLTRRNPALTQHARSTDSVAVSPDGTWLATTQDSRGLRIWDRATGRCTAKLTGHSGAVTSVAISPDGSWLATTSWDKTVRLWDRATGRCTSKLTGHTGGVTSVAISPDGSWLATTSNDKTVRLWNRGTGSCVATLTGHTHWVTSVAISPDGTWLATTSRDETIRIWDPGTGSCTATLTGHTGGVTSVAISPDGTWLATTSDDKTVRLWDLEFVNHYPSLPDSTDTVVSVAISPNGGWLATAGYDKTVRIWDRATGNCTAVLTGHINTVYGVAISPDGTWLATAQNGRTVAIWDRATGVCTATFTTSTNAVRAVAISPDGSWLATAGYDKTVRIWDRATGNCTATLTGHTAAVQFVTISPEGTWIATTSHDETIRIWDRGTGSCTATLTGHTGGVTSVAISPDGSWLATASYDKTVRIWDRATGNCTATLTGHTGGVTSVAISPDGSWLATASYDKTLRIWDVAAQRTVAVVRTEWALYSCAWSPTAHELAVGGEQSVYLFELLT
ncbi:NB-ARC domain-containing protein [Streptomyces arenae]|uniref:NB-ARC domain-containing protein n=1 Tax=Streptomyces arenae TaxID=29301 RepID=UPI00265ADC92|nr:NB-ARC domain-containing protein [Streptomyces arenae]MCG7204462.1 NB-ARC domain-containing protein [Streptomyces arenae]